MCFSRSVLVVKEHIPFESKIRGQGMVVESIFSSRDKGKGEKIFIYLDWTAWKIEGKGGQQQSFEKREDVIAEIMISITIQWY
jgi:hypothetical protein